MWWSTMSVLETTVQFPILIPPITGNRTLASHLLRWDLIVTSVKQRTSNLHKGKAHLAHSSEGWDF